MTSNGIANTPSRFHSAGRAIWGWVGGGYLGILWMSLFGESVYASQSSPSDVLGDLVDAVASGSKIYTLRGGGWLRSDVFAACRGYVVVLVLGDLVTRRHFSRRSSIQGDEISCIRDLK